MLVEKALYVSFALPVGVTAFLFLDASPLVQFPLAAVALLPLAWLIGEATDQVGAHTGAVVGGLLNATFGNAVELFVAYFAIANGDFDIVRGSLVGSVVSNALLVGGLAMLVGGRARLDRRSTLVSLGQLALALPLLVAPALPYLLGDEVDSRTPAVLSFPPFAALFVAYWASTAWLLRKESREEHAQDDAEWSLRRALVMLAVGVAAAGFVSEIMTSGIRGFADGIGVSVFFVSAVLVALAGNAAEHGSAILVALRGHTRLGVEVALKSSSQVAAMLIPAVAMLSWLLKPLPPDFRAVELGVLGGTVVTLGVLVAAQSTRARGAVLLAAYAAAVAVFYAFAG